MPLELAELGVVTAELMERLEADYAEHASVSLGIVAVVAEINYDDGDGDEVTAVEYRCSEGRRWVQSGLFAAAGRAVLESSENPEDD